MHEALLFSARLRLSKDVSSMQMHDFVAEVCWASTLLCGPSIEATAFWASVLAFAPPVLRCCHLWYRPTIQQPS